MRILRMRRCLSWEREIFSGFWRILSHISNSSRWIAVLFLPIRLNEPKKCVYLFQRASVKRKPNKWVNGRNRILSKICRQDFMKYIHFVALYIQNNCVKFREFYRRNMDKFDFLPFYSTHNRGRLCYHGNRLLSKFIGNNLGKSTMI